jgi:hypothetical protein
MNKLKIAVVCAVFLLSLNTRGQDIPLGALPMLYNGGFAGDADHARFTTGFGIRKFWFSPTSSTLYFLSYDQFIPKVRTGFGVSLITGHTKTNDPYLSEWNGINSTSIITSISPKFSFRGKYTLAPFVDFRCANSYYMSAVRDSVSGYSLEPGWNTSFRGGLLFNSKKGYIGFTLDGFRNNSRPFYEFPDGLVGISISPPQTLFQSLTIQYGYTYQRLPESKFSFTTQLAYIILADHHNAPVQKRSQLFPMVTRYTNFTVRYSKFLLSLNSNGIGLGLQNEKFRVMLSSNFSSIGSVTMRYVFKK